MRSPWPHYVSPPLFHLTFYDLFALRTIGKADVPYRIAALADSPSYSIGPQCRRQASFTGGAVRYRIYSAWGLNAVDVAKVCFVAGLTFWLGNAAVLAWACFITRRPPLRSISCRPGSTASLAVVILAALVGYVAWVWIKPRQVGRGTWTVVLPGGPLTLLQIAIGIIDLGFCALAMFILLPEEPMSALSWWR